MEPPTLDANHIPDVIRRYKPDPALPAPAVYFLTVVPGLEPVAADEAARKLNTPVLAVMRGKVFFTASQPFAFEQMRKLNCADNIYALACFGRLGTTRDALSRSGEALKAAGFDGWLARSGLSSPSFTVNASVSGRHTYSRFEAAAAVARALEEDYRLKPGENNRRDLEFRLDMIDGCFLLSVKLTDASFRFRGANRQFAKAALRPTVAHALVWVSGPREGEVFLDPFCGSGTILCERAAYPYQSLTGGDIDEAAVAAARENLRGINAPAQVFNGSIESLHMANASVDSLVTNPPWGGQIKTEDARALYGVLMCRAAAWLKPKGKMTVLTPLVEILTDAARSVSFTAEIKYTVSLHGTLCHVCGLQRSAK